MVDTTTKIRGISNPNIGLYRRALNLGILADFLRDGPAIFGIALANPASIVSLRCVTTPRSVSNSVVAASDVGQRCVTTRLLPPTDVPILQWRGFG